MKEEIKLNGNLDSEIVKIVNIDEDKYEVYFNFLTIPVRVNRDYLDTILQEQLADGQMKISA